MSRCWPTSGSRRRAVSADLDLGPHRKRGDTFLFGRKRQQHSIKLCDRQDPAVERSRQQEVSVWLSSRLTRGASGELTRVQVPLATKLVRLRLELESNEYSAYRATLHEAVGTELWSQRNLAAATIDGRTGVSLTLPAELLAAGDYYVNLDGVLPTEGVEHLSRFDFRVSRR